MKPRNLVPLEVQDDDAADDGPGGAKEVRLGNLEGDEGAVGGWRLISSTTVCKNAGSDRLLYNFFP